MKTLSTGTCDNCGKEFTSLEARWYVKSAEEYVCGNKCFAESFERNRSIGEYDNDFLTETFHELP